MGGLSPMTWGHKGTSTPPPRRGLLNLKTWGRKTKGFVVVMLLALVIGAGWYTTDVRSETRVPRTLQNMADGQVQIANDAGETLALRVKLARDSSEWQAGLLGAGTKTIEDTMVLFVETRIVRIGLTARNLRAPLDVAFFDAQGMIQEIQRMNPDSERIFRPARDPYLWALQARAGFFEEMGITAEGSHMVINSVRTVR